MRAGGTAHSVQCALCKHGALWSDSRDPEKRLGAVAYTCGTSTRGLEWGGPLELACQLVLPNWWVPGLLKEPVSKHKVEYNRGRSLTLIPGFTGVHVLTPICTDEHVHTYKVYICCRSQLSLVTAQCTLLWMMAGFMCLGQSTCLLCLEYWVQTIHEVHMHAHMYTCTYTE